VDFRPRPRARHCRWLALHTHQNPLAFLAPGHFSHLRGPGSAVESAARSAHSKPLAHVVRCAGWPNEPLCISTRPLPGIRGIPTASTITPLASLVIVPHRYRHPVDDASAALLVEGAHKVVYAVPDGTRAAEPNNTILSGSECLTIPATTLLTASCISPFSMFRV